MNEQIERIVATQAEHGLLLASIVERLDSVGIQLKAVETAIQLLSGNILALRTELLVVKGMLHENNGLAET